MLSMAARRGSAWSKAGGRMKTGLPKQPFLSEESNLLFFVLSVEVEEIVEIAVVTVVGTIIPVRVGDAAGV